MNLARLLTKNSISFKQLDKDGKYTIIKIENKLLVLCIEERGNIFKLHRDYYDYIACNSLPYMILLNDTKNKKDYLLNLTKEVNWVKGSFESCDKDEIFLGKQVINNPITEARFIDILEKHYREN